MGTSVGWNLNLPSLTVGLLTSMPRSDQINHRLVTRYERRVHRVGGQKVAVTGAQRVNFVADAQLQLTADNPVRLIFVVRMRTIFSSGLIAPLKNAITFIRQACLQLAGVRSFRVTPFIDLYAHFAFASQTSVRDGLERKRPRLPLFHNQQPRRLRSSQLLITAPASD